MAQTPHRSTSRVLDIFDLLSTTMEGFTLTEITQKQHPANFADHGFAELYRSGLPDQSLYDRYQFVLCRLDIS